MSKRKVLAASVMLMAAIFGAEGKKVATAEPQNQSLKTEKDSLSYAMGLTTGMVYRGNLEEFPGGTEVVDTDILSAGFKAGVKGDSTKQLMTKKEARLMLQKYLLMRAKAMKEAEEKAYNAQKPINDKYFEEKLKTGKYTELNNATRTDCHGTLLNIQKEGKGDLIKKSDYVCINYKSKLTDGTVFDESNDSTAVFPLDGVINGMADALLKMKKGTKAEIIVPSELGYGKQDVPNGSIPANSILIFDVDVIEIFKSEEAAQEYMDLKGVSFDDEEITEEDED